MAKIRTRARAVDMLGRQQIATVQNALAELFKNAHDAYADAVLVDFFENEGPDEKGLIVIRDNGVGMTRDDFENKWLVLGTESKLGKRGREHFRPTGKPVRPITGEKGIGRLAIALLGTQVLVLSRALRKDGLHDLVVGWLHWGMFEIPEVNLDDIEIPIATVPGGRLPSAAEIEDLRQELIDGIEAVGEKYSELGVELAEIIREVRAFDPGLETFHRFLNSRADRISELTEEGAGTHFIVAPANPVIQLELEAEDKDNDYGFRKKLMGFSDAVFGDREEPVIETSFCRWPKGAISGDEYLLAETFFTKRDLTERSDHFLRGDVDKFGQFNGELRIYKKDYSDLTIPWSGNQNRLTQCGPFSVVFGVLQGDKKETMLDSEDWVEMYRKLNHLGGIYIYRDGIRILPYGDHSVDWLDVEKNRTKSAKYYYFSFRKMFGAVLLSREKNEALQEKAGREGLQANKAYRELRDILKNLLENLTAEFFREGGENTEQFVDDKSRRKRKAEALEKAKKNKRDKKDKFKASLQQFFERVQRGEPERRIDELQKSTNAQMLGASEIEDQDRAAAHLVRAEKEAIDVLSGIRQEYTERKPAGVSLGKEIEHLWKVCLSERDRLETTVFGPFEKQVAKTLGEVAQQARIYIDQRKRLDERLRALEQERKRQLKEASDLANASASDTRKAVTSITEKARQALDDTIRNIEADLNRTPINELDTDEVEALRSKWESEIAEIETRHREGLMAARDMLSSLAENLRSSDGAAPADLMEAMEERMEDLEEQADQDFEMVQLGLAIAIINHEFAAAIKQIRHSVRDLGNASRRSNALKPIYESIRSNFEHLDGHLKLFTPLQRRLYRKPVTITGKHIRNYIRDVFQNRLERHRVDVEANDEFLAFSVSCYPSALYPALINIIDNAIYWVGEKPGDSTIRLDADATGITISNNGPKIPSRDSKRIFERGYSRKPGGRGLGCFISSRALSEEGMTLSLAPGTKGFPVAFKIEIPAKTEVS